MIREEWNLFILLRILVTKYKSARVPRRKHLALNTCSFPTTMRAAYVHIQYAYSNMRRMSFL